MKRDALEFLPLARKEGLVIKEVDDEVLVYDLARDQAHCLNASAAGIWRLCDGKNSVDQLAITFGRASGAKPDASLILLGLQDLQRNHLLENGNLANQSVGVGMSRREAVRRIGIGAAIAVPLVISISAPTAVQAAVSCSARCKPCSSGTECCSGVCMDTPSGCNPGTRRCA
ncbi:MAG TPA: hypothetical protein VNO50_13725 [Pyrinomonadaceae bacterium]|nr:hypothetical protein [Pyrinomonadaceae bacterium]